MLQYHRIYHKDFPLIPNPIFKCIFNQNILQQQIIRKIDGAANLRLDFYDDFLLRKTKIKNVFKDGI